MMETVTFTTLLCGYLERAGKLTAGQLAARLNDKKIPFSRDTAYNWTGGKTKRPRYWLDIVHVARELNLTEVETSELLQAAGHPTIDELRLTASGPEADLLRYWDVPCQEIEDLPHFTGREAELAELEAHLRVRQRVVVSIVGMPGVGKTTLAAHLARRLRPHFPDGILWADLEQSNVMAMLSSFVRPYGHDVSEYAGLQERSRVVRDILARKRVLIVLDNVQSDSEIRDLLPVGGRAGVIITTRHHNLWSARYGHCLTLGPFDEDREESLQLMARLLGEETCRNDRETLLSIMRLVGHLPLAVDIIGSRLVYEPGWTIPRFWAWLQQEKRRLNLLKYNDEVGVRISINASYEALPPELQTFWVSLGAFGGEDFDMAAAACVTQTDPTATRENLTKLYMLSLLQVARSSERYRLHPLLREYAREKMGASDPVRRMVHYYVTYAGENQSAYEALDIEYSNIEAALWAAWEHERVTDLVNGAKALFRYWETRGLYETALIHLEHAQEVARRLDNPVAMAQTLHRLGRLAVRRGEYRQAGELYEEGLALADKVDLPDLVCAFQQSLGALAARQGKMLQAEQWTQKALAQARELGDHDRIFNLLNNLGGITADRGQLSQARQWYQEALVLSKQINGRGLEKRLGILLQNLGRLASDQGDTAEAETYYQQAWQLAETSDDQTRLCGLLDNLGYELLLRGDPQEAERHFQRGLKIARRINSPLFISRQRANQGLTAAQRGDYEQADRRYRDALQLANDMGATWDICLTLNRWGNRYLQEQAWAKAEERFEEARQLAETAGFAEHLARVWFGLAQTAVGMGLRDTARQRGQKSYALFTKMEHRLAVKVQVWLNEIESATSVDEMAQ